MNYTLTDILSKDKNINRKGFLLTQNEQKYKITKHYKNNKFPVLFQKKKIH